MICLFVASCTVFKEEKETIITGEVTWDYWKSNSGWDLRTYYELNPDSFLIKKLSDLVITQKVSFIIFASSFCHDCMEELPKIYKIIDKAEIPYSSIKLIGLDKDYKEPTGIYRKFHFKTLPLVAICQPQKDTIVISAPQDDWLKAFIISLKK